MYRKKLQIAKIIAKKKWNKIIELNIEKKNTFVKRNQSENRFFGAHFISFVTDKNP